MKLNTLQFLRLAFFITIILGTKASLGQTLTVSGSNWSVNPGTIVEAGADYTNTFESSSDQLKIDFDFVLLTYSFNILVKYEGNPTWNNNLKISLKRTGNGNNCLGCSVSSGTSYLELTTTNQTLFTIQRGILSGLNYTNIPIQIKLSGISATVPAASYNSKIVFTIGN